jgi:acyl-CoA thioester hydrolase
MPLKYTRDFRIRNYECDPNGHLNNANYLRLMQETAIDASSAAGYDSTRYQKMDKRWLIRSSQVEFLNPVMDKDRIRITTWIGNFRRVSSRRVYEFTDQITGERNAVGYTDWVFVDANTFAPTRIPSDLVKAFLPQGAPGGFPDRTPTLQQPDPPEGVFKFQRKVEWLDIDQMGHVNNAVYLNYSTECNIQVLKAYGWPWERMRECGFGIYIRRLQVQYLLPAHLGDYLEVATWASGIQRSTATRHYIVSKLGSGEIIAKINNYSVWVDLTTKHPIRIPAEYLKDFSTNIVK